MILSLTILISRLLSRNSFRINENELEVQILSHPSYPSLHAVTGVLDHFNISNSALKLPITEGVIEQLPTSFFAQIDSGEGDSFVLIKRSKNNVHYLDEGLKEKTLSIRKFVELWTGVIVVVENGNNSSTVNNIYSSVILQVVLGIFLIFGIVHYGSHSILSGLSILIALVGTIISVLVLKYDLGFNSETINKICTASETSSCNDVIKSNGATILGDFKLSDISIVYFASLLLGFIMFEFAGIGDSGIIIITGLITIPVIIYSIYQQKFIVKKWCALCLAIVATLFAQFIIAITFSSYITLITIKHLYLISISTLLISVVFGFVKPLLKSKIDLKNNKIEYNKFKRKFSIFEFLHNSNSYIDTSISSELDEITYGNPDSANRLIIITSPTCFYCKKTHEQLNSIVKNRNVHISIRFNIGVKEKSAEAYQIATRLYQLYEADKELCYSEMSKVYKEGVNILNWLGSFQKEIKTDYHDLIATQQKWCFENELNFTPAIILNNKLYPKEYDLEDLQYFIEDLILQNQVDII